MTDRDGDHLAERVDLHSVVAGFRRYSLSSRDLVAIRRVAVEGIATALDVPLAALGRWSGVRRLTVIDARAAAGWLPPDDHLDATGWAASDVEVADVAGFWSPPVAGSVDLSVAVLPAGRAWGRVGVAAPGGRAFTPPEVDFLRAMANLLAAAVERARGERAQAAVSEFGLFALQSRDVAETMDRAVGVVAGVLEAPTAVLARAVPGSPAPGRPVPGRPLSGRPGSWTAGETMEVVAALDVPGWSAGTRFRRDGDLRALGAVSAFAAPVLVDGASWGLLMVLDRWRRTLSPEETDFVGSVAHMLAAAIARGQVEERLRETTRQLQQALLPTELPELPGVQAAGRYASVAGNEVGGDWFDVLPLPEGGVGLVIGDVEGHDSTAASVMGQVRNVLRAYAAEGHTPEEILGRLDRFVAERTSRLVSCLYAEVHPAERTITLVSAGHQPPLVLDSALRPVRSRLETGVVLGADPRQGYLERTGLLPPGATLVLATDGLVGGHRALYEGAGQVVRALARADSIRTAAEDLLAAGRPLADDAAVLIVRLTPARPRRGSLREDPRGEPRDVVRRNFRSHASAPPAARRFVSDVLVDWGLADLEDVSVLVLSELMTNAVVHTTGPIELSLHRMGPGRLWMGVRDDSDRPPVAASAEPDDLGGRGLGIVEALAARWGSTPVPGRGGKTVWAEITTDLDGADDGPRDGDADGDAPGLGTPQPVAS